MSYNKKIIFKNRSDKISESLIIDIVSMYYSQVNIKEYGFTTTIDDFLSKIDVEYFSKLDNRYKIIFYMLEKTKNIFIEINKDIDKIKLLKKTTDFLKSVFLDDESCGYIDNILYSSIKEKVEYITLTNLEDLVEKIYVILHYEKLNYHSEKLSDSIMESLTLRNHDDCIRAYENIRKINNDLHDEFENVTLTKKCVKSNTLSDLAKNIREVYRVATDRHKIIETGITALNKTFGYNAGMLESTVYCFVAPPNTFKSMLLFYIMIWTIKYNHKKYIDEFKITGKRPTILFFSLENDSRNDDERIFFLLTGVSIKSLPNDDEVHNLFNKVLSDLNSCIEYKIIHNSDNFNSSSQNIGFTLTDVQKEMKKVENDGGKVICLIIDYIEKLKSEPGDVPPREDLRLTKIANTMLSIAQTYKIPIITAQQMNRPGIEVLANEKNMSNYDGMAKLNYNHIGGSHGIGTVFPWAMFLNICETPDKERFLGFKFIRNRGDQGDFDDLFYVRLHNRVILEEDLFSNHKRHITSLNKYIESKKIDNLSENINKPNIRKLEEKKIVKKEETNIDYLVNEFFSKSIDILNIDKSKELWKKFEK